MRWSSWPQCGSNALRDASLLSHTAVEEMLLSSLLCACVSVWPIPWLWRLAALKYWVAQIQSSSETLNRTRKGPLSSHEQTSSTGMDLYETLGFWARPQSMFIAAEHNEFEMGWLYNGSRVTHRDLRSSLHWNHCMPD